MQSFCQLWKTWWNLLPKAKLTIHDFWYKSVCLGGIYKKKDENIQNGVKLKNKFTIYKLSLCIYVIPPLLCLSSLPPSPEYSNRYLFVLFYYIEEKRNMMSLLIQKQQTKASSQPPKLLVHNLQLLSEQRLHDSAESGTLSASHSSNRDYK